MELAKTITDRGTEAGLTVWFAVNSERGTRSIRQLFEGDSMAVQ